MTVHCVTCGTALHPERAKKYTYCMARECQEKNARGLTMVAVGMNKAADELMILDEQTREELASGKYRDQRRGTFGGSAPAPGASGPFVRPVRSAEPRPVSAAQPPRRAEPRLPAPRRPWTDRQERLARLYNEQGLRPDEIARKLGVSNYLATQIVLAARSRAKR